MTLENWAAKSAGDRVLENLTTITGPQVLGAHDADFVITDGKAYVVYMASDQRAGHHAMWVEMYVAMAIVDVATCRVEKTITFGASEMEYGNTALPVGACFVPRVLQVNKQTLRCFFTSEHPGHRDS